MKRDDYSMPRLLAAQQRRQSIIDFLQALRGLVTTRWWLRSLPSTPIPIRTRYAGWYRAC
jgi:hypothetical protein